MIENGIEKRVYTEYPADEEIEGLSFDSDLRERAVIDRRLFNRPYYLNPEDLTDYNPKWQSDCAITEQAMLVGEGFVERGS